MSPFTSTPDGGPRTPVQFDQRTGDLRIGEYERHVDDPAQPEQVYGAYLSLLYAVRRVKPGEQLQLRSADLEALLLIVGDDPETIESRLIDLMGCTPAEAGVLGRLLLRQRRATATLGIAALSLAGVGLAAQLTGSDEVAAPVVASVAGAVQAEAEAPLAPVVAGPAAVAPPAAVSAPVEVASVAPAPVRTVVFVGPQVPAPLAVAPPAPAPVAPAPAPAAPVAPAPAPVEPAAPVAPPVPVEVIAPEDRYVLPLAEQPVMDAPPPVDVPESGIGEAISLEPEELEPISGIGGSEDHVHEPVEEIGGVTESGDHELPEPVETGIVEPEPVPLPRIEPAAPAAESVPVDPQG